jgi:hypothetical protein
MEDLELLESKVTVLITLQGQVDDKFTRKLLFSVTTRENQAEFLKFRSSQDFLYLRSQMMKKWVGFLIPSFPKLSFSLLRSISPESMTRKTRFLQEFIEECVSNPELFACSDIQLFLKGPENYIENSKNVLVDFKELYLKMMYKLKELPEVSFDSLIIRGQYEHLCTCLAELKAMKKKIKMVSGIFEQIQNNQVMFFIQFEKMENFYLSKLGSDEEPMNALDHFGSGKNPFGQILDWTTRECFIFRSVIEEVEKFFDLEKQLEKTQKKLFKKSDDLKILETGKRPLSAMFSLKNTENIKNKSSEDLKDLESEEQSMQLLLRILYLHLTTKTLPQMTTDKLKRYQDSLESLSLSTISCFTQNN